MSAIKWGYLCKLHHLSSFLLSFPPKLGGKKRWDQRDYFPPPFSVYFLFSPEPNKRKCHFSPYFHFLVFHSPRFHHNQTYPKKIITGFMKGCHCCTMPILIFCRSLLFIFLYNLIPKTMAPTK